MSEYLDGERQGYYDGRRDGLNEAEERLGALIDRAGAHWLALQVEHPVAWEGALDEAMAAACAEIRRLAAENATLRGGAEPTTDDEAPVDDRARGLYAKWRVERLNDPLGKHAQCRVLVLDPTHDPFAVEALRAYAHACGDEYPKLAGDIFEWVGYEPPHYLTGLERGRQEVARLPHPRVRELEVENTTLRERLQEALTRMHEFRWAATGYADAVKDLLEEFHKGFDNVREYITTQARMDDAIPELVGGPAPFLDDAQIAARLQTLLTRRPAQASDDTGDRDDDAEVPE